MRGFTSEDYRALAFATLAGLSTAIGGLIAVLRTPDNALLAFLLGTAIGVMSTLSIVEMWFNNGLEHGFLEVTICTIVGALIYIILGPLVPEIELPMAKKHSLDDKQHELAVVAPEKNAVSAASSAGTDPSAKAPLAGPVVSRSRASSSANKATGARGEGDQGAPSHPSGDPHSQDPLPESAAEVTRKRGLMRLGLLMAVTMTLHNLPEGFAVAFASFTDFGPTMAFAVAMHNIPEGIIVAAPIFASTGSRKMAVGMSLLSGLSEPLGAVIALLAVGPYLTPRGLQLLLALVGGIMTAVCAVELLPEGRRCKEDGRLMWGTVVGAAIMGATLAVGV